MFCPNCGMQSPDDLKYCRSCGTDIGIVSKALTGALTTPPARMSKRERRRARKGDGDCDTSVPRLDRAVSHAFGGFAFMFVSIAVFLFAPAGHIWFFWMLIPAFMQLGQAVGEYIRWKQAGSPSNIPVRPASPALSAPQQQPQVAPYAPPPSVVDVPRSFEHMPPPSVTEDTTRHLDARAGPSTAEQGAPDR